MMPNFYIADISRRCLDSGNESKNTVGLQNDGQDCRNGAARPDLRGCQGGGGRLHQAPRWRDAGIPILGNARYLRRGRKSGRASHCLAVALAGGGRKPANPPLSGEQPAHADAVGSFGGLKAGEIVGGDCPAAEYLEFFDGRPLGPQLAAPDSADGGAGCGDSRRNAYVIQIVLGHVLG